MLDLGAHGVLLHDLKSRPTPSFGRESLTTPKHITSIVGVACRTAVPLVPITRGFKQLLFPRSSSTFRCFPFERLIAWILYFEESLVTIQTIAS